MCDGKARYNVVIHVKDRSGSFKSQLRLCTRPTDLPPAAVGLYASPAAGAESFLLF